MAESLPLRNVPKWKHAGQLAKDVYHVQPTLSENAEEQEFPIVFADGALYKITNGYLIPHYEPRREERQLRKQELLADRVQKFFYAVKPGLDVKCTKEGLEAEFAAYDKAYGVVKSINPNFTLSTPYRLMSRQERALVNQGATLAGHSVNRLGRLGQVILQGNRTGVDIEYTKNAIRRKMPEIKEEFTELYNSLIDGRYDDLARCLISRDKRIDHDGIFGYYMHEIGKIITDDVSPSIAKLEAEAKKLDTISTTADTIEQREEAATKHELLLKRIDTMSARMEDFTRHGIVTNIGFALGAIDQTNSNLQIILKHPLFSDYLTRTQKMVEHETHPLEPRTHDIDIKEYRAILREYVELCKARTCIRSEDTEHFTPISQHISFLENELALYHSVMFAAADKTRNQTASEATSLLKRGVSLIGEMSELRLPRNANAPCVYDKDLPEFKDRDASSVGRLAEKIQLLSQGKLQGVGIDSNR